MSASTKTALPSGSTAIDIGKLSSAVAPGPSEIPSAPVPAQVETTPSGVTSRIRWFQLSATRSVPCAVSASPIGWVNAALRPMPSPNPPQRVDALSSPATSETCPCSITRI